MVTRTPRTPLDHQEMVPDDLANRIIHDAQLRVLTKPTLTERAEAAGAAVAAALEADLEAVATDVATRPLSPTRDVTAERLEPSIVTRWLAAHRDHEIMVTYRCTVQFRTSIAGATPLNPKLIEPWLRSKTGVTDEDEIRKMVRRTLEELGVDPEVANSDDMEKASEILAARTATVGFKRDSHGLYVEQRIVKAALRESTNILFAGVDKWGPTRKGPKSYLVERVFVGPERLYLGVQEPDEVMLFIGHVTGPKGPTSNLTYHELVHQARLTFEVQIVQDALELPKWMQILRSAQEQGLGALRSQGFGRFDVLEWEPVSAGLRGNAPALDLGAL